MKAIVHEKYGPPEVLELKEVDKPVPKDNEVLLKVHSASVNSSDYEFLTGSPLYTRMWGFLKPKINILGSDVSGLVEEVGSNVSQFKSGDAAFGDIFGYWGGFAEYVCVPENTLIIKPTSITFEEAAAIPQAALVALQGIKDKGDVQRGQKVLINGAGGGAGTFAVQIGNLFGAEVTGVDHTAKLDMMRSIGAKHVIDYTHEDFTKNGKQYDLILDLIASHSIFEYKRALSPGGVYIMVGGSLRHLFQTLFFGILISLTGRKKMGILGAKPNKHMDYMIKMIESGKIVPVIDKYYTLDEVPEALRYLGEGYARGKVVVTVCN
jgi:NADPH:quinone reductase-like Zn-dependent oxidoreductase